MKSPTTIPSFSPLSVIPTFTTFLGGSGSSLVNIYFGKKRYELNDWLGNVRVLMSKKYLSSRTGFYTKRLESKYREVKKNSKSRK